MAKKQKPNNSNNNNVKNGFTSITYKNFNSSSSGSKRRNQKNRKKYFEHDTRTRATGNTSANKRPNRTLVSPMQGAASIKKIKFNNEINIFETKQNNSAGGSAQIKSELIYPKQSKVPKKRRNNRNRQASAISKANIQSTTKKLQKQLIETQKKLQKQLTELQKHQREQSSSFLALIRSSCMHTIDKAIATAATTDSNSDAVNASSQSISDLKKSMSNSLHLHSNNNCSENFCKHFTDQSKCPNDKMAKGNKATTIR